MGKPLSGSKPPNGGPPESRLDSWKEIAAYLKRDVTTAQRWEKREGMPVHRHLHDKRGSVYAVPAELDAWKTSRGQILEKEDAEALPADTAADADVPRAAGDVPPTAARSSSLGWIVLAAVLACGLAAVLLLTSRNRSTSNPSPTDDASVNRSAPAKIRSLAVLPLKNLSGDPAQDYLADGMTEALIGRLSAIRDLHVISRTSVARFKNPQLSVPEIARMLHVDALVEGSVMRDGNRIRITAQLIRGSTDEHFWSETYDRELKDVFELQSELAQAIAEKVQVTVTGAEHERLKAARVVAPEVYESYLKGQFALSQSNTRSDMERSAAFFEETIRRDPTFAPGYLGLADAYDALGTVHGGASPRRDASENDRRNTKGAGTGSEYRRRARVTRRNAARGMEMERG